LSKATRQSAKARLTSYYSSLKNAYLGELGYVVPPAYQSCFVNWYGSAEVQFIFKRFLENIPAGGKVLIIGVMGGRDYFLCKNLGYEVVAVDLGPQSEIEPIVCCNVEDGLPFADSTFDAVIMAEVLEHLVRDVDALGHVRRVLKPNGKLIVSLPYFNDSEEGHVRIHSPKSGERLMMMGGFGVEDYLERPGLIWARKLNALVHGMSLATYWLSGRTVYGGATRLVGNAEYRLGHLTWLRAIRKMSRFFGGYYLCSKSAALDYVALNRMLYTHAGVSGEQRLES
jgi:SAM-dependent methyltransferase